MEYVKQVAFVAERRSEKNEDYTDIVKNPSKWAVG